MTWVLMRASQARYGFQLDVEAAFTALMVFTMGERLFKNIQLQSSFCPE